ncbi:MAG: hypothetical protein M3O67_00170 [Bacteroidota bacterium]|nr:hypothetical protein [Bacteroidota bacterium]
MEISFLKGKNKKNTISIQRKDGTVTWMQCDIFFVLHDLMHYAVETTLNYRNAFYGMLESGVNITDFVIPKDQRAFELTAEALAVENIVNLMLIQYNQGVSGDFHQLLLEAYSLNSPGLQPPLITNEQLQNMRKKFDSLALQWFSLPEEKKLVLSF